MKVVIQRCQQASVSISGQCVGKIQQGYVLLVGIAQDDTEQDVDYSVKKITQMRLFSDEHGKMNLSLADVNGAILSISQFTLLANIKKGNRPSFTQAADPQKAKAFYELFNHKLQAEGFTVETGRFGADMQVSLINDGPVTIILDTQQR